VKQERTVYLYVTSVLPPHVAMPHLEDRSLRQAVAILETYGLKLAKPVKRKPDVCNGCVLSQEYKGKRIAEGAQIERGSEITLTVGDGHNGEGTVDIPNLVGLTLREAILRLNESNLNEGAAIYDKKQKEKSDTLNARVYKQVPAPGSDNAISPGSSIDIYLTNDKSKLQSP
jgi:beta-lactam-binding protein with PASTA domain